MSMPGRLERLASLPIRAPKRTLAILLVVATLVGSGILRLGFDPSSERVFPEGHPAVLTFQKFRAAFGGDEAIFVAVEARAGEDAFSPSTLTLLRELVAEGEAIDGIVRAFALPDLPILRTNPLSGPTLDTKVLPQDLGDASPELLAQWRRDVLATPFVDAQCVSADRRATLAFFVLEQLGVGAAGAEKNAAIVRDVLALVAAKQADGWTIHTAGTPLIKAAIMGSIQEDLATFAAPLLLIALVASGLVLRSVRGTGLVLAVLVVSCDLTLGFMGHLGIAIDPMNTMVPILIVVIGVADCLHLLVEQKAQAARLGEEADGAATIRAAVGHVLTPCFLTSLTTAIGFGSLITSDIAPVADFGVAAALSSLLTFGVTMLLVPAACALMAPPSPKSMRAVRADALSAAVVRWPKRSLCVGAAASLALALGATQLVVDTNFLEFFAEDTALVRDAKRIQELFAGIAPAELLVEAPPGSSERPEVLRALLSLERELENLEIVDTALSAADFVAASVGVMTGTARIPETREAVLGVQGVLRQLAGGELPLEQLIAPPGGEHPDHEWLRVSVRAHAVGSTRYGELSAEVQRLGALHLAPLGATVAATGTSVVFSQTADRIMQGQIESFAWAMVFITIVMIVALRSLPLGLLSVIPNLVPIGAMVGAMGYLEIPLNSFNSMIASIAIGIAVDDTIHILTGFKRLSADRPVKEAISETVAHEGAAILATSLVLFSGFCVLLLASFLPTANFGLLTAIAIAFALMGDLVVLPGLLLLIWPSRVSAPPSEG